MDPDPDLIPLVLVRPDGPWTSLWAVALLTGYAPAEVRALGPLRLDDLPPELARAARRRASEAMAHTRTRDMLSGFRFWAGETFNVELVLKDDGVWMPRPNVDGWRADG